MGSQAEAIDEGLARLQRRVAQHQQTIVQVQKERQNLRLFFGASFVVPWPVWIFWDWKLALFVWSCCWMFFGAGHYLNFMHLRNAQQDLDAAESTLREAEAAARQATAPNA